MRSEIVSVLRVRHPGRRVGTLLRSLSRFGPIYTMAEFLTSARYVVQGDSMRPNFVRDQYILVSRLAYLDQPPSRGDVVVLRHPWHRGRSYLKRIVGLPGERVLVHGGCVVIDEKPLEEAYLTRGSGSPGSQCSNSVLPSDANAMRASNAVPDTHKEWVLDDNQYSVLGDNRGSSDDSRSLGPVDRNLIVGRAWFRYWPRTAWGFLT